jgi:branched-chain amino acid transport system substrate-binding protein
LLGGQLSHSLWSVLLRQFSGWVATLDMLCCVQRGSKCLTERRTRNVIGFARLLLPKRRNVNVSGRRERAGGDRQRDQGRPGPAALFSAPGLAETAYMKMINDQGGINGRKINLISVDDGYLPWRTANETRKLIEVERVAFIFGSIATPTQLAVATYLNNRKIPQLFIDSGAYRWGNYTATPYTMGGVRPSYRVGARFYIQYILKQNPNAKICILYQNDDFGRDYTAGARDVLGDRYAATVKEASYEFTDASINRQIIELKATGCNALIAATVLQFAVQAIRKVNELG